MGNGRNGRGVKSSFLLLAFLYAPFLSIGGEISVWLLMQQLAQRFGPGFFLQGVVEGRDFHEIGTGSGD